MTLDAVKYFTTVMTHPDIVALLDTRIHWDLAESNVDYPFLTFELADTGYSSKNRIMTYNATVRIYAETMTEAVTIGGTVRETVKTNHPSIYDRGSRFGYTDTSAKEAVIEIKFEFKN